jgi:hypothetical protein
VQVVVVDLVSIIKQALAACYCSNYYHYTNYYCYHYCLLLATTLQLHTETERLQLAHRVEVEREVQQRRAQTAAAAAAQLQQVQTAARKEIAEAADLIAAQQRRVEQLEAALSDARSARARADIEVDRLQANEQQLSARLDALTAAAHTAAATAQAREQAAYELNAQQREQRVWDSSHSSSGLMRTPRHPQQQPLSPQRSSAQQQQQHYVRDSAYGKQWSTTPVRLLNTYSSGPARVSVVSPAVSAVRQRYSAETVQQHAPQQQQHPAQQQQQQHQSLDELLQSFSGAAVSQQKR